MRTFRRALKGLVTRYLAIREIAHPEYRPDWKMIVHLFRAKILPRQEWNHQAHLAVGLRYLLDARGNVDVALCHLKPDIILFNDSIGVRNDAANGYHETITVFHLNQLAAFLKSQKSKDFDVLIDLLLKSRLADPEYIYLFYDKRVLDTARARAGYVPSSIWHQNAPIASA